MQISLRHLALIAAAVSAVTLLGCDDNNTTAATPHAPASYTVSTLAGSGVFGTVDGPGATAHFHNPVNVAVDSFGTLYIADYDNSEIREVTPTGFVTTLTAQDGFSRPFGITFTPDGKLYVSTDDDDDGNHSSTTGSVWNIDLSTGVATPIATDIGRPRGLTALPNGQLVLVDLNRSIVSTLDPSTGTLAILAGQDGTPGFSNGTGAAAEFSRPYGAAILPNGDILLADQSNNCLREVTEAGAVTTFAGTGTPGATDGSKDQATFNEPEDVAVDAAGNIYVDDHNNQVIRVIDPSGNVTTVAGGLPAGFADGVGLDARFYGQEGIALSPDGSILYVADGTDGDDSQPYSRIRAMTLP